MQDTVDCYLHRMHHRLPLFSSFSSDLLHASAFCMLGTHTGTKRRIAVKPSSVSAAQISLFIEIHFLGWALLETSQTETYTHIKSAASIIVSLNSTILHITLTQTTITFSIRHENDIYIYELFEVSLWLSIIFILVRITFRRSIRGGKVCVRAARKLWDAIDVIVCIRMRDIVINLEYGVFPVSNDTDTVKIWSWRIAKVLGLALRLYYAHMTTYNKLHLHFFHS